MPAPRGTPGSDRTGRRWIGVIIFVAVGLAFIWRSLADLPLGTIGDPGPAAAPLLLAMLLVIVAVWSARDNRPPDADDVEDSTAQPGGARHAALLVGAAIAAALALNSLGYRLTILAILLFFLGLIERKPAVTVLIVSVALAFGSFALFDRVLKVLLPTGPFGI